MSHTHGADKWREQCEAKARIEREAPALLAALKALLAFDEIRDVCDKGPQDEGWKSPELRAAFALADRAVARAEGREP